MNNKFKRLIAIVLTIALSVGFAMPFGVSAATIDNVGVLWDGFTSGAGTFTVTDSSRVFVVASSAPTGDFLQTIQLIQRELKAQFSELDLNLVWGDLSLTRKGDIVLKLDTSSGTGADGYKLDVNDTTATVTAADTDGLIYGANNLIKCFRAVGSSTISCFSGADAPDTKQRVVSLDTGRKYYTVEWICNFIRQLSWMGYNALELHFSDDGGFRVDLWDPKYYKGDFKPQNDFSWLCGSHLADWVDSYFVDPDANKYLTTAELVQICEVAKEYHIEIIPSFDSPAHMDYITWKFEQNYLVNPSYSFIYSREEPYRASDVNGCINYTGAKGFDHPDWPYYSTLNIANLTSMAFVFALYEDIANFFREYAGSNNFSIGADEVNLNPSNLASGYSFTWDYSYFPGYVNALNRMLNGKGYTVRMFNDFIGSTVYNGSGSYAFDSNIEIMYWNSPFEPTSGSSVDPYWPAHYFWQVQGRTMYNCIQTNCYYVQRLAQNDNGDARDPLNRNWNFYHSTEQDIYNEWYPADLGEKGDYSETVTDVPANQLGGAYFLIWSDYAGLCTEAELWEGSRDKWFGPNVYYLLDRMASNIIKMWNSDINSTVTYDKFASVRNTFGYFPGYTSCSAAASLPAATAPIQADAADHSALEEALNHVKTEQGNYTDASWRAYVAAVEAAEEVHANPSASAEEIAAAVAGIENAEAALVLVVDKSALQTAVDSAHKEQGNYTDDSWSTYITALEAAKAVLNDADATQEEVNTALANLNNAAGALVVNTEGVVQICSVRKICNYTIKGKKVGLVITTTPNVEQVAVTLNGAAVALDLNIHNIQKLNGEDVCVWMVNFPATEVGTFTYTITANGAVSETVEIVIK